MTAGSLLEKEIHEQPDAIRRLLEAETGSVATLADSLRGQFNYVTIAARGTSDNAARYAQYLLGAYNRLQVALATPSLFSIYHRPPNLEGALVIGISQSGRSPDIIETVAEGSRQGRPTLAITNDLDSPLAQAAQYAIDLHTGVERAVAATKTYTSSLAALALLSCLLEKDDGRLQQLHRVPALMEQTIQGLPGALSRVERYRYMDRSVVIGRGFNYATAFEIALKIKELTRVVTEPYSSADFRHGPVALVGEGFPVMIIAPNGEVYSDLYSLAEELELLKAELLVISDKQELLERARLAFPLPEDLPEWLTPLIAVIPGQLFGYALARARGLDPDQPEGLQKVTETR
jgi:glutamine---fructose-6-phosphate transaminase (isomerizing)